MIESLILVLIVLAALALVWWGIGKLAIPDPVKTVVLVILGLVMLGFLYKMFVGGGLP